MKGNHPQSDSRLPQATGRAFDLANDSVVKLWDVALGPLTKKRRTVGGMAGFGFVLFWEISILKCLCQKIKTCVLT